MKQDKIWVIQIEIYWPTTLLYKKYIYLPKSKAKINTNVGEKLIL